jgi:hypothetical protein
MRTLEPASALVLLVVVILWFWLVRVHQTDATSYVGILGALVMGLLRPVWKKKALEPSTTATTPVTAEPVPVAAHAAPESGAVVGDIPVTLDITEADTKPKRKIIPRGDDSP